MSDFARPIRAEGCFLQFDCRLTTLDACGPRGDQRKSAYFSFARGYSRSEDRQLKPTDFAKRSDFWTLGSVGQRRSGGSANGMERIGISCGEEEFEPSSGVGHNLKRHAPLRAKDRKLARNGADRSSNAKKCNHTR